MAAADHSQRWITDPDELSKRFAVEFIDNDATDILVHFKAPSECLYSGYWWDVQVKVPDGYPKIPPKIFFKDKIFHPNIDPKSGLVSVDILQAPTWRSRYDLCFVFEMVIPELLRQPDLGEWIHTEAQNLLKKNPKKYEDRVRAECEKFARKA